MKKSFHHLEEFRVTSKSHPLATAAGDHFGAFYIRHGIGALVCIADDGVAHHGELIDSGWEHVSVRYSQPRGDSIPTWDQMNFIRDLFWEPEETVMQIHPPHEDYVNIHPCVLHLWRPIHQEIPRPPKGLV